jgi:hypothetical protein
MMESHRDDINATGFFEYQQAGATIMASLRDWGFPSGIHYGSQRLAGKMMESHRDDINATGFFEYQQVYFSKKPINNKSIRIIGCKYQNQ